MENPLTPAGIEPATFRSVAQHLNHCATAVPSKLEFETFKLRRQDASCHYIFVVSLSPCGRYQDAYVKSWPLPSASRLASCAAVLYILRCWQRRKQTAKYHLDFTLLKNRIVPVYAMKITRGGRGIESRWRWVVSFTPRLLYLVEISR